MTACAIQQCRNLGKDGKPKANLLDAHERMTESENRMAIWQEKYDEHGNLIELKCFGPNVMGKGDALK